MYVCMYVCMCRRWFEQERSDLHNYALTYGKRGDMGSDDDNNEDMTAIVAEGKTDEKMSTLKRNSEGTDEFLNIHAYPNILSS